MDAPTSYFGNVGLDLPAAAPSTVYQAAAVASPDPAPRGGSVALYVGVAIAVTILLMAAWWWSRGNFDQRSSNSPETLELEDFRQRIAAIENPEHRADMEEWLRFCRGSTRPTVNAILIEVLRSNLGPGAGGTAPPPDNQNLTPPEAARPNTPPAPSFRLEAAAPHDDQNFVRFQ
jgi:hypothetical protein